MLPPEAVAPLILENVRDAVFATDPLNRVTFWAPSAERMFGIRAGEALGHPFGELLPFDIAAASGEEELLTTLGAGRAWRGEGSVRLRDGTVLWIESTVSPLVMDGRVVGGVSVSRDMTAHRAETRGREAAERALRALSTLNRALVRVSDEATLLDEACRIAVDAAGYRFALVAYADDDAQKTVRPVAWAGTDGGYLDSARITWADEPRGRGPVGTAIRTGQPDTMREPDDHRFEPWRDELGRAGFLSLAALPLAADGRTFGALAVYATERDAFDGTERELLVEMAGDLAYGIVTRRTQAAHDQAVEAMRRSEERYRTVVDALAEGVVVQDGTGAIVAANPAARAILGWRTRSGPVPAQWPERFVHEDGSPFAPRDHPAATTLRTGRARRNVVMGLPRPSGDVRWIAIHTDPLRDGGGSPNVVSSFEDVTHYRAARAEQLFEARLRTALSEAVQGIPVGAGLEHSARTITAQVATLPGIDLVGVGAFLGEDELVILASHVPDGDPPRGTRTLPAESARYIRDRTADGPWAQYVRNLTEAGPWSAELEGLGVLGVAVGPIVHGDHVDGVLLIGSREREPARILVEKMPAVVAFSATSSALLAAELHARREEVTRRRRIERVIADSAFHPVFQPIVDLGSRQPVGYEALTRFDSGQRPDLCFRDAWSAGYGPELEAAALRAAVDAATGLPAGLWLDLNLSPRLVLAPDRIAGILQGADRPLVLEITEHEQVGDYRALHESVRRLGKDIRVAVDDAGAGVANFRHIVEMRPDFVKLDISLVRQVNNDLGRQALVVAMRQFARSSGCRLVGEGVETELEASTLAQLGVEFGQGYLFGRPEPVGGPGDAGADASSRA